VPLTVFQFIHKELTNVHESIDVTLPGSRLGIRSVAFCFSTPLSVSAGCG